MGEQGATLYTVGEVVRGTALEEDLSDATRGVAATVTRVGTGLLGSSTSNGLLFVYYDSSNKSFFHFFIDFYKLLAHIRRISMNQHESA